MKKMCLTLSIIMILVTITSCGSQPNHNFDATDIVSIAKEASSYFEKVEEIDEYNTVIYIDDHKVTCSDGIIFVDGQSSGIKTPIKEIYDVVRELYISGEWNGEKTVYRNHTIELDTQWDKSGYILIDGNVYVRDNLDLPSDMDFSNVNSQNYQYILGEGTYIIENDRLVKYLRGKKFDLQGEELIPEKLKNRTNYEKFYMDCPMLLYDYINNMLFLLYDDNQKAIYPKELYVFKDYNFSKVELVEDDMDQCWIDKENGLKYRLAIHSSSEKEGKRYYDTAYTFVTYVKK